MAENVLPEKLRAQIAQTIIRAMENVFRSYEKHTASIAVVKDDDFYEAHKNARMALTHMELLIKLARSLGVRDPVIEQAEKACMQEAYDDWSVFETDNETTRT